MISKVKIFKTQQLIQELDDSEFNQFLAHLVSKCGRSVLLNPFFSQYFASHLQPQYHEYHFEIASTLATTIIKSRSYNKQHNLPFYHQKLDTLPIPMINNISSYLCQHGYSSLSRCNKSIYIGCNDPISITKLDLTQVADYHAIPLHQWRNLTELKICTGQLTRLCSYTTDSILARLSTLTLNVQDPDDISVYLLQQKIPTKFTNIHYLCIHSFGSRIIAGDIAVFLRLLKAVPNVMRLELKNVYTSVPIGHHINLVGLMPRLASFAFYDGSVDLRNCIIKHYGSQLSALHINAEPVLPTYILPELNELCVWRPCPTIINRLCNNSKSLTIVKLLDLSKFVPDQLQSIITQFLVKFTSLQYLSLLQDDFFYWKDIFDSIELALFNIIHPRPNLKIVIEFGQSDICMPKSDQLFLYISRVINKLRAKTLNNYLLSITMYGIPDNVFQHHMHRLLDSIRSSCGYKFLCDDRWFSMTIYNANSNNNGWYREGSTTFDTSYYSKQHKQLYSLLNDI